MLIAFAFNTKSLAIAILLFLFFIFFLLVTFSGQTAKSFLVNVLSKVIKKACDQDLTHSWDTLKSLSIKVVSQVVIHGARGTWHGLYTVTSIHSIQKTTRIGQEVGDKLFSGWQNIQGSKQRKIELTSKKVWKQNKVENVQIKNFIAAPCEAI